MHEKYTLGIGALHNCLLLGKPGMFCSNLLLAQVSNYANSIRGTDGMITIVGFSFSD